LTNPLTNLTGFKSRTLAITVLYIILLAAAYYSTFTWLVTMDWVREDYSSSCLVPLIVGYLIWEKRRMLTAMESKPTWKGIILVTAGIILFGLGELAGEFFTLYISFWLVLVGLVWTHCGTEKLRELLFPLVFLLAMFPLPNFINSTVTLKLKLLSSRLGVDMIQLCGMSAYREGNVIDLGFTKLQVVDACSGLRYFIPLIVLSLLLAYYFRARSWKKIVLVLSAIPISVITNGMRIASVGILYKYWGPMVAEGFFHNFSGWFIFMFSLGLLLLEMQVLKKIGRQRTTNSEQLIANYEKSEIRKQNSELGLTAFPFTKSAVAAILMIAAIFVSYSIDYHEKVPASRPFAEFPLRVANWQGVRNTMEKIYLDELKFDDYVMIDYNDPQRKTVSFYTAYFGSQTKGGSIHSPASCLPGGGWVFEESGDASFPLKDGAGEMRVSRAYMQKDGVRELTYYWFPQHGRILTNLYELKLNTFWEALTERRTDGALVRVITPVYETERLADAEARLQGFTREICPVLAMFLPK